MNVAESMLNVGDDTAVALVAPEEVLTFSELRRRAGKVALALQARGHAKGERIGILAENSPFFVAAYLGVIRAGLVAVPLQTES
jgi:acyl-CoA synthetase (AMP-forming)/AMP-acid ligase II